ncbi:MAG TPA: FKBP-type peptidyl-prolyl cis-trans isomerase [Jatrophihabitans sp.]
MATQKQRRDAARRHLERQVQRRAEREATRKKFTLIASVAGTLVVIALVIVLVVVIGGSDSDKAPAASATGSSSGSPTASATSSAVASGSPVPTATGSGSPVVGATVDFEGVHVTGANKLSDPPTVTSTATKDPAKFEYKDLAVGSGPAATPTSNVTVQYTGILYKAGDKPFDSSWDRGQPAEFSLTGVVPGFTQGIGGGDGTPAMKVGGRRLIILPAAMGYGDQSPSTDIPANSPLVFIVDLVSLDSATSSAAAPAASGSPAAS